VANVSTALGNVLLVDHGLTSCDEALQPSDPSATRRYRPKLARPELTHGQPYNHGLTVSPQPDGALPLSAAATVKQDVQQSAPRVSLRAPADAAATWTVQADLLESAPFAQDFVAELDDD